MVSTPTEMANTTRQTRTQYVDLLLLTQPSVVGGTGINESRHSGPAARR